MSGSHEQTKIWKTSDENFPSEHVVVGSVYTCCEYSMCVCVFFRPRSLIHGFFFSSCVRQTQPGHVRMAHRCNHTQMERRVLEVKLLTEESQ